MSNQVFALYTGYSRTDNDDNKLMYANCSCTLIRTKNGRNIIVDTMTAWDGDRIKGALAIHQLLPEDIHAVVCTHGHSDHTGCNYLFLNAEWHITGACISQRDKYVQWDWEAAAFQLDVDNVMVVKTPGHTLQCVTVLVHNTQLGEMLGICGDLFEKVEDIDKAELWLEAGSENAKEQRRQRLQLAEICDYIIPGHGEGFVVTGAMRTKLRQQLQTDCNEQ